MDYDVLLERYEIKEMQTIWINSHIYMLRKAHTQGFEHDQTDAAMEMKFKTMVNAGVKLGKYLYEYNWTSFYAHDIDTANSKESKAAFSSAAPALSGKQQTFKLDQRESTKDL